MLTIIICIIVGIIILLKVIDTICNMPYSDIKLTDKEQSYVDWNIRNGRDAYDGTSHGMDYNNDRY